MKISPDYFILDNLTDEQKSGLGHYMKRQGITADHDILAYIACKPAYLSRAGAEEWNAIRKECRNKYGDNIMLFGGIVCRKTPYLTVDAKIEEP